MSSADMKGHVYVNLQEEEDNDRIEWIFEDEHFSLSIIEYHNW